MGDHDKVEIATQHARMTQPSNVTQPDFWGKVGNVQVEVSVNSGSEVDLVKKSFVSSLCLVH